MSSTEVYAIVERLIALVAFITRQSQVVLNQSWPDLVLTPHQWFALATLHHGPVHMRKLADLLQVSLTNATGIVDRLERKGLVARERSAQDRRLVMVQLTETAKGLNQAIIEARFAALVPALTDLPAAERDTLLRALDRLQANLFASGAPLYLQTEQDEGET